MLALVGGMCAALGQTKQNNSSDLFSGCLKAIEIVNILKVLPVLRFDFLSFNNDV